MIYAGQKAINFVFTNASSVGKIIASESYKVSVDVFVCVASIFSLNGCREKKNKINSTLRARKTLAWWVGNVA